jgi:hypothetical protein
MFTDDAAGLAEAMAPAFETTPDAVLDSPVALVGTLDEMIETLERRRERWDMTYQVIGHDHLDAFARAVERLVKG